MSAPSASADEVWHQSIGRASADAPCPASDPADLAAGWTEWTPTWEEWPNDGQGGYTCTRSNTWAKSASGPLAFSAVCFLVYTDGDQFNEYLNFLYTDSLPIDSPIYADSACADYIGYNTGYWFVLVPEGEDADEACKVAFGEEAYASNEEWESNIHDCLDVEV